MTSVKVVKATKPFLSGSKILSLCAITLASLLTFQYHTNTQNLAQFTSLENSIASLESKISGIDTYLKELGELIKQQNVQSQNYYDQSQESTPENRVLDGGVYDIQGHAPHSRYLNNIETLKDDPRTPVDPLREYTYDDFQSVFEVEPLHKVEITKEAAEIIDNHNVTDDNYYITWPEEIKELQVKFAGFLDADSLEQRDREYMVVKWVSPLEGFGVFANKDIKEGELIGRYTGEIVRDIQDTDYAWIYMTREHDGEGVYLSVDGLKKGNYLRFINHKGSERNTVADYLNHNNMWHVIYVAGRDIAAGEELTTNYGDSYFESRM